VPCATLWLIWCSSNIETSRVMRENARQPLYIANILHRSAPPRVWNSIIILRLSYRVTLTWTLFTVILIYLGASTVAEEEDNDARRFRVCIFFIRYLSGVLWDVPRLGDIIYMTYYYFNIWSCEYNIIPRACALNMST